MSKSKVEMSDEQKKKCHKIIHTATVASGAAGAIPIPLSDTIPISAAQITMIIALGKVFDFEIGKSAVKSIIGVGLASQAGRAIVSSVLKIIPGVGSVVGAATAVAITEALGWLVADDFYRMSIGQAPENIAEAASDIRGHFSQLKK
ncbi:MAG: GTP-binding protein [Oscillospiraceae bacterium]|jgi:uncharacterized protein (DUF697 family)|nr:GTP-binding protein [Oscillospiraceae bacterium]